MDGDSGSNRSGNILLRHNCSIMIVFQNCSQLRMSVSCGNGQLGQSTKTGESFSTETKCFHGGEIGEISEFRSCMFDCQSLEVVLLHPVTVVSNLDILSSIISQFDLNDCGMSIKTVFHQLLDSCCQTQDHLSTTDLMNNTFVNLLDTTSSNCSCFYILNVFFLCHFIHLKRLNFIICKKIKSINKIRNLMLVNKLFKIFNKFFLSFLYRFSNCGSVSVVNFCIFSNVF